MEKGNETGADGEKAQTPQTAGTEVQQEGLSAEGEPVSNAQPETVTAEAPTSAGNAVSTLAEPATVETAPIEPASESLDPAQVSVASEPQTDDRESKPSEVDPRQAAPQAGVQPPPETIPDAVADAASPDDALPESTAVVVKPDDAEEQRGEEMAANETKQLETPSDIAQDGVTTEPEVKAKQEQAPEQGEGRHPDVVALDSKVAEVKTAVDEAQQKAQMALGQASALATAAGLPFNPPIPVPPEMVPPVQPPTVDPSKLEQQAAAVNMDIQRRRDVAFQAEQQYARQEQERQAQAAQQRRVAQQTGYDEDEPSSPQERAMPPRRAASARAAQNFRRDADDYLSDSANDSPLDSPRAQKKPLAPKPKPPTPTAAKPTQSKDSGADAWDEPPQKQMVLKMTDITKALQKKWLQLYWPDDGKWWPCQVVFVDPRKKTANVLYETGEEEADLGLAELVEKGEVAWLNANDAKPEVQTRRGYADYDEPSSSRGRGKKQTYSDEDEEDDDEEGWAPGRKRRAAAKGRAKYEEESEPESSESESPPPSEQSSDWHSSEDDDKPKRRPKKKKRATRPPPRAAQPSHHHQHHHSSHQRDRPAHMGGNINRGSIFDDTPGFGGSFGSSEAMRMQQQRNQGMGRDQMQGWGGMGGNNRGQAQHPSQWNRQSQGLDHIMQQNRQQQMGSGNMGQLHIPQVSMQGNQMMDISRYQQAQAAQAAAQGMRGGHQMGWRPQPGADLMRTGEWAQMQQNPLYRLQQMGGGQMGHQQAGGQMGQLPSLVQQQMLQQQQQMQRIAQQQQQNQQAAQPNDSSGTQRQAPNLGASTRNMEGIVAQGMNVSGKKVEVQQANGQWTKGTIMAVMARGPQGGSALVHFENGEQKQLSVNEEGRSYNIKMMAA